MRLQLWLLMRLQFWLLTRRFRCGFDCRCGAGCGNE
jgi:hypothetical protein